MNEEVPRGKRRLRFLECGLVWGMVGCNEGEYGGSAVHAVGI